MATPKRRNGTSITRIGGETGRNGTSITRISRNGVGETAAKRDIHNPNQPKRRSRNGTPIKFSSYSDSEMGHPSKQDTVKFPPCSDFYGCP